MKTSAIKFLYVPDIARPYLATDPRDKVSALLAHHTAQTKQGKPFIESDYSESLLEVYRDLALRMIDYNRSIEVLSAVQHDPSPEVIDDTFPPWVPRWDVTTTAACSAATPIIFSPVGIPKLSSQRLTTSTFSKSKASSSIPFLFIRGFSRPPSSTSPPMAIMGPNPMKVIWLD